jgi:glycerol-3-phosphate cytidylyltransferase-like family protein
MFIANIRFILSALIISICIIISTTIPVLAQDDKFDQRVIATGLVDSADSILFSSNVYFYPRKKGMSLLGGGKRIKGQFVLTDNSLAVLEWDRWDKTYEIIHQENYQALNSVEIAGGSLVIRLVTETKQSGRHNSFEIMDGRNAVTANIDKTRKAKDIVMAGMRGLDVETVAMSDDDLMAVSTKQQEQQMQTLEERLERLEKAVNLQRSEDSQECDCKCPQ